MKSTLKARFAPNGKAVIKVIRPNSVVNLKEDEDYDERDEIVNHLIQSPLNIEPYNLYEAFSHPIHEGGENFVTTIMPIEPKDQFDWFKHAILNRIVPYLDLVKINQGYSPIATGKDSPAERIETSHMKHRRIVDFFTWLSDTGECTWSEQKGNE